MSDRTSHRRRARKSSMDKMRAGVDFIDAALDASRLRALGGYAPGEPMSVLCNKCGLPCLWQECFETCQSKSRTEQASK